MERVHLARPAPHGRRRLLVRLCLFAFCGGLLLLLSSRPAGAAERREPGLLDPVRTTLKATAREVDSFAGRATGSGSSTVGQVADAARHAVAPQPRPAAGAARSTTAPTVRRGAPAVTSPVRRAAPPTTPVTRHLTRTTGTAARPATRASTGPAARASKLLAHPADRVAKPTSTAPGAGSLQGVLAPVVGLTGPVLRPLAPALTPVGSALAPVGSALAPVGAALAPVPGPVVGLVPPVLPGGLVPGLAGPGAGSPAGAGTRRPMVPFAGLGGPASPRLVPTASQTYPARPAADGASSPATRSIRSWPALTGAVSLPGFPTSAELPAGGPDPLSSSSGAGLGLAAVAAAMLLLGLLGRGRARPHRSGLLSRSYLPLVSPA